VAALDATPDGEGPAGDDPATILERDRKLAGDINPMLARHGESSEARQYSGRLVTDDWTCPFKDPRQEEK
jgi:FPC/CPF motif-containing protein YcgG